MSNEKKYILLQNGYSIAYNDTECFEDGIAKKLEIEQQEITPKLIMEKAIELKKSFYNNFFKKHYKNLVVLTAAGTSLDNGKNKGKTRYDLWNYCESEIDTFKSKIAGIENKSFFEKKNI